MVKGSNPDCNTSVKTGLILLHSGEKIIEVKSMIKDGVFDMNSEIVS